MCRKKVCGGVVSNHSILKGLILPGTLEFLGLYGTLPHSQNNMMFKGGGMELAKTITVALCVKSRVKRPLNIAETRNQVYANGVLSL